MMHILMNEVNTLPNVPGVYFFYDKDDQLIYVGKSINIKKRVQQHFAGKDRKAQKIQLFTHKISYEHTGNELIALLYESDLIKQHQPLYNRSQRRTIYHYGLYVENCNGYLGLRIGKLSSEMQEITTFSTAKEAKDALFRITEKYRLCQKINDLYKTSGSCFQYQIKECNGACLNLEAPDSYNQRVNSFLARISLSKFTQLFEVLGRNEQEKGLVYIENGVYKGFGFCPIKTNSKQILNYIEYRQDNKDVRRILMRYLLTLTSSF